MTRFGPLRKVRLLWLNGLLLVVLLAGLVVNLLWISSSNMPRWVHVPPIAMMFAVIMLFSFSIAAYLLEFTRLYIYGVMAGLSPIVVNGYTCRQASLTTASR